jgi:hypothetical protein
MHVDSASVKQQHIDAHMKLAAKVEQGALNVLLRHIWATPTSLTPLLTMDVSHCCPWASVQGNALAAKLAVRLDNPDTTSHVLAGK